MAKQKPDKLVNDGTILQGTPLHRLQTIHADPEAEILVGDVRDVCANLDPKDKLVSELVERHADKRKGEVATIKAGEVKHLTNLLLVPAKA